MTSRRPNERATGSARDMREDAGAVATPLPTLAINSPRDDSGRLALVLATFALAVATFLIILVAIAASNA